MSFEDDDRCWPHTAPTWGALLACVVWVLLDRAWPAGAVVALTAVLALVDFVTRSFAS